MIVVKADHLSSLTLGRQGENLARKVVFDLSDWSAEYGAGTAELIVQRPGENTPYPAAIEQDGAAVTWTLTAADTALASTMDAGNGHCELRWYVGDVLVKSKIWRTWVDKAMDATTAETPPEPEKSWVDQVLSAGIAAENAAADAKSDADRAAALAAEVAEKASQTTKDATAAAQAKEAAMTAQRLAEDAQRAAEAAKQAAETAKESVAQSATDAEGAKQAAESALKSTQDAAATAAQALSDILALYQEMQTWAQGVVQDVNEAGSHAVQSVQSAGDAQVQRVTDEGTTQTANAKAQADAAALSAAGAAQSAHEAAESAAVYDNVVSDVNQLKQDVEHLAPTIVCQSSGYGITLNDSSNRPFSGLNLYGKTTQDGTPSPDSPVPLVSAGSAGTVEVQVAGKNLLNTNGLEETTTAGVKVTPVYENGQLQYIRVNGTVTSDFSVFDMFFKVKAGMTYVLNGSQKVSNQNMLRLNLETVGSDISSGVTYTAIEDKVMKVYVWGKSGAVYNDEKLYPMVRLASIEDATYEPYKEVQSLSISAPNGLPGIPVDSGGNYTDSTGQQWICDEVDFTRGKLIKRVLSVCIPDNLQGGNVLTHSDFHPYDGISRFVYRNVDLLKPASMLMSNLFPYSRWLKDGEFITPHGQVGQLNIQVNTDRLATDDVAGLLAWAQEHPITILAQMVAPVETDLSDEVLAAYAALHTYKPNTTICNDADAEMEVSYQADTKLYIDKQFAELKNAIVSLGGNV